MLLGSRLQPPKEELEEARPRRGAPRLPPALLRFWGPVGDGMGTAPLHQTVPGRDIPAGPGHRSWQLLHTRAVLEAPWRSHWVLLHCQGGEWCCRLGCRRVWGRGVMSSGAEHPILLPSSRHEAWHVYELGAHWAHGCAPLPPAPRGAHAGPTPRATHPGCRQAPKTGIMVCTKDNDSESCYWLFSKRNSFLLEN